MDDYKLKIAHWRAKHRQNNLVARYGIGVAKYEALLRYQEGKCAGCGKPAGEVKRGLAVDHDHQCCPYGANKTLSACGSCIRGLLCVRCNMQDVLAGAPHVDWVAIMENSKKH